MKLLRKFFSKYGVRLISYCLMGNHAHLAVIPEHECSLADGAGRLHKDFSRWQNIQRDRVGHLWQNRFFSCPVEEDRERDVLAHVKMNPVRTGIVKNAWDWEWSSARAHIENKDPTGLLDMDYRQKTYDPKEWKEYLERKTAEESFCDSIRGATSTGRLLGKNETARYLEEKLGKTLLPKKRGRKPKIS